MDLEARVCCFRVRRFLMTSDGDVIGGHCFCDAGTRVRSVMIVGVVWRVFGCRGGSG